MADDARLSTALPRHPKTVKLRRHLGEAGCWGLVCLFLWAADSRSDGDLSGMSTEDLEIAADWNGEAGSLVKELRAVGFIDGEEGSYQIHDWAEHNPFAATKGKRVAAARKAAAVRWGCDSDASRMQDAQKGNTHHHTPPHTTPRTPTDSASDVAGFVMDGMELSGRDMRWTVEDAVKTAIRSGMLPSDAAEFIVNRWAEYSAAEIGFKKGKKGFLAEGLFMPNAEWEKPNAKPVGKYTQLLSTVSEPYGEPGEQFGATRDRQS